MSWRFLNCRKNIARAVSVLVMFFCFFAPSFAYAAPPADLKELMTRVGLFIINPLILLFVSLGLIVFLWGLFQYLTKLDNAEERRQGVEHMIWGVVGLFIMLSVYSIIAVIKGTFFLN